MSPLSLLQELEPQPQEFTKEIFWEMWGDKSGFEQDQFEAMWSEAEQLMTDLPYHNFLHVRKVLWACMQIADEYEAATGEELNRRILISAPLVHDGWFHKDHKAEGHETKEAWSADTYDKIMPKYGLKTDEIQTGKQAITATTAGVPAETIYDLTLVCADLLSAAGDYDEVFMPDGDKLFEEWNIMHTEDEQKTASEYADFTIWLLSKYAVENLGATERRQDYDPREEVLPLILANIKRKAMMCAIEEQETLEAYARRVDALYNSSDVAAALDLPAAA